MALLEGIQYMQYSHCEVCSKGHRHCIQARHLHYVSKVWWFLSGSLRSKYLLVWQLTVNTHTHKREFFFFFILIHTYVHFCYFILTLDVVM